MGIELLERAADAEGRILRVEQLADAGGHFGDPQRGAAFLLTFDVGRILVRPAEDGGHLELEQIENPNAVKSEREPLDEEEPWWRVLGNPIVRAWPGAGDAVSADAPVADVRIQFRHDDENPKVVRMCLDDGQVAISLEAAR